MTNIYYSIANNWFPAIQRPDNAFAWYDEIHLFKYPNKTVYIKAISFISRWWNRRKKNAYVAIWFDWLPFSWRTCCCGTCRALESVSVCWCFCCCCNCSTSKISPYVCALYECKMKYFSSTTKTLPFGECGNDVKIPKYWWVEMHWQTRTPSSHCEFIFTLFLSLYENWSLKFKLNARCHFFQTNEN